MRANPSPNPKVSQGEMHVKSNVRLLGVTEPSQSQVCDPTGDPTGDSAPGT